MIGYFYLFSYFEAWGLSTLEIGFSIIDYATVAIYPIFLLIGKSFAFFFLGYVLIHQELIKKIICGKTEKRKTLIYSLMYLVPLSIWVVYLPIWKFSFSDWPDITFTVNIYSYYLGLTLGIHRYSRKSYTKLAFYILLAILLFSLPICSSLIGTSFPKINRKYSFNPLKFPTEITKVIIYTSNPISEFEIFQTANNKYEGLMLLVYKNDIYYFVADLSKKEIFFKASKQKDKEIESIFKEMKIEQNKIKTNEADDIELKKIREDMDVLKKETLTESERIDISKRIDAKLDAMKKSSKKDKEILSGIKERLNEVNIKIAQMKKLNEALSNMFDSTFAIRKDQIKHITYLREEKEKN
ncbi:hypothetical protein GH153_05315 [bacterium]|nr:hypothetical protein [bacterium]